jgi:hypothetical protein
VQSEPCNNQPRTLAEISPQYLTKQKLDKKVLTAEPESVEYAAVDEAMPQDEERE